jgi:bifunctional oligoribonuclease and PAP phosphatase NrnA
VTAPSTADWDAALAQLRTADEVVLACHVAPDGDALGSMLGLAEALRTGGRRVLASFGSEPFVVPDSYAHLPATDLLVPPDALPEAPALLVTLDTSSPDRLGSLAPLVDRAGCTLVVDHHASGRAYGDLHLVDTGAAATAVLVAEIVDRLGLPLTAEVAAALYTGLVTDTGSFKYSATTPAVHELAARLLATGIRHDLISRAIYDTQPFAYVRLLGATVARAVLEPTEAGGLGLVWTTVTGPDLADTGLGLADVEGVIDVVRVAQEAEVAVVLKADPVEGGWKVSTRSKGAVDVGEVCRSLGGGGHRFAAGFSADGPAAQVLSELRSRLAEAPHLTP